MREYESISKIKLNGPKLVRLRASKKWTQERAAKKAKVSLPTYKSAESGNELQAAIAGKIAGAYGVLVEDLELTPEAVSA